MLAMIAMADADHDGSISLDEFYHLASTLAEVEQLKSGGCAVGKSSVLLPRLPQPALRALPSILLLVGRTGGGCSHCSQSCSTPNHPRHTRGCHGRDWLGGRTVQASTSMLRRRMLQPALALPRLMAQSPGNPGSNAAAGCVDDAFSSSSVFHVATCMTRRGRRCRQQARCRHRRHHHRGCTQMVGTNTLQ